MSYNSLVGILADGDGGGDADLSGHYLLQETTGTSFHDRSGNARHGTSSGLGTNPPTTAGPTGWLSSSVLFSGTTARIVLPDSVIPSGSAAFSVFVRCRADASGQAYAFGSAATNNGRMYLGCNAGRTPLFRIGDSAETSRGSSIGSSWSSLAASFAGGNGSDLTPYINGVAQTAFAVTTKGTTVSPQIGGSVGFDNWNGPISEVATFHRALSGDEIAELTAGPEPVNTVAPSAPSGTQTEGQTLTASNGTWDSQSNGTISYSYQWTRSDDGSGTGEADISGATSATYLLAAGDVGKYIRCRVRASNLGGFDAAEDTASAFTGEIAPAMTFKPYWARRTTQILGGR